MPDRNDTDTDAIPAVWSNPNILGGTPVFYGTRVPAHYLADFLKSGHTLDGFLSKQPTVSRAQAERFLDEACGAMLADLEPVDIRVRVANRARIYAGPPPTPDPPAPAAPSPS